LYDLTVLKVHAPREGKTYDMKNSLYEELDRVFDKFPKHHLNILLGISMKDWIGKIFSIQQFGMRVHMKLIMLIELE
jgi:hypothetical protein